MAPLLRLLAVIVCPAMPAAVYAQDAKPNLQIVIENIDAEGRRCGVDPDSLDSVSRLTLSNNGISSSRFLSNPYLYVRALAQETFAGGRAIGCTIYLEVSAQAVEVVPNKINGFAPRRLRVNVPLCRSGTIFSGSKPSLPASVSRNLEQQIKLCLSELDY